jgi:hypothetical protein
MPTTTGVQQDILASTLRVLARDAKDSTFRAIALLDAVRSAGNIEEVSGGSYVDIPLVLTDHSTITQLSNGYESVSLAVKDVMRTGSSIWCDAVAPIVITKKEELSNKGERALVKIAETRMKQVVGMLQREVNKQIVAGNSAILTDLNTLRAATNGSTEKGFLTATNFGSQDGSPQGVSKASFPQSYQNQFIDVGGTLTINEMQQLLVQTKVFGPEGDVDIILASPNSYSAYRSLLEDNERYTSIKEMQDMSGRLALVFGGAPVYIEPSMNGVNASNGNPLSQYFLNSKLFNLYTDPDAFFEVEAMQSIPGYASMAANIMVRCQLTASNLSGHGILTNGEAV